jgi:hypothetical protein
MRLAGDQSKPLRRSWKTNKGKRMSYKKQTVITGWLPYRLGGEIGYDRRREYVLNGHWKIDSIKKFLEKRTLIQGKADHAVLETSGEKRYFSERVYDFYEGAAQVTPHGLVRI